MFWDLADRIDGLLAIQDAALDSEFSNLTIGAPGSCGAAFSTYPYLFRSGAGTVAARARSFERRRPQALVPETFSGRGAERRRQQPAPPRRDERRRPVLPRRDDFARREDLPRRDDFARREDRYRTPAQRLTLSPNRFDEPDYFGRGDEIDDWPQAPDPPGSPTTTTTFSQSSSTSSSIQHWVPKVFEQSQSNTPFRTIASAYVRQLTTRFLF